MNAIRLTPAGHVLLFLDRLENNPAKKNGSVAEVVASTFACSAGDFKFSQITYAQTRHVDAMRRFVQKSAETKEAKGVYGETLHAVQGMVSYSGLAQPWSNCLQNVLPVRRPQLILLDSFLRPHLGTLPVENDHIDDIEARFLSAIEDVENAGGDEALVLRIKELTAALMFGLRNIDVLGPELAWERASALIFELAARDKGLKSDVARGTKKVLGALCAVIAALAVANSTLGDINGIMSNIQEIGSKAIEWEASGRRLIEDQRPDKGISN